MRSPTPRHTSPVCRPPPFPSNAPTARPGCGPAPRPFAAAVDPVRWPMRSVSTPPIDAVTVRADGLAGGHPRPEWVAAPCATSQRPPVCRRSPPSRARRSCPFRLAVTGSRQPGIAGGLLAHARGRRTLDPGHGARRSGARPGCGATDQGDAGASVHPQALRDLSDPLDLVLLTEILDAPRRLVATAPHQECGGACWRWRRHTWPGRSAAPRSRPDRGSRALPTLGPSAHLSSRIGRLGAWNGAARDQRPREDVRHARTRGRCPARRRLPGPTWLQKPADVNALHPSLWATSVGRSRDGVLCRRGRVGHRPGAQFGTPAYVVDEADFRARAAEFVQTYNEIFEDLCGGADVYYAGKAFLCTEIARWIRDDGLFLDVCSGGELAVAIRAGMPGCPDRHARQQQEPGRARSGRRLRRRADHRRLLRGDRPARRDRRPTGRTRRSWSG
jgi:hypothetical protein